MDSTQNIISFCTGYGGIELGLKLAGLDVRTIAYVEIEAFACANLVAKIEQGKMDAAPIWTDIKTFDGRPFRDRVHGITGGYPCQPFSIGGRHRLGSKDLRHLWPYIEEHIRTINPVWCFFENVQGHLQLGFKEVAESLRQMGYSVEAGVFGTQELGFDHSRPRLFILAYTEGWRGGWGDDDTDPKKWKVPDVQEIEQTLVWSKAEGRIRNEPTSGIKSKPLLDRRTDGFRNWNHRLRLLGNGVVPQTAALAWKTLTRRQYEPHQA